MILKSIHNQKVEIRIKDFDRPGGNSDMDLLRVTVSGSSGKVSWQAEHHCFTPREALMLSKWLRRLAGKEHGFADSIKFHDPALRFKAEALKRGTKKVVIELRDRLRPPFVKARRAYFIPLELTDKELKQAAFDLKNEIPLCTKMNLPGIIKMDAAAIRMLVSENAPDTIRYAEGIKMKSIAPANGNEDEMGMLVKHEGEHAKCNDDHLFWAPFIGEVFKGMRDNAKLLTPEWYEQALKKNFCPLLTERLTGHFKNIFFDIDTRFKNSQQSAAGTQQMNNDESKPGRIDESFIDFYKDDFYKEDADNMVGSVYVNFSFNEITCNPLCISFKVNPADAFMKLFNYNFKMALGFLKSNAPAVFFEAITDRKIKCDYQHIKLKYEFNLPETFKKNNYDYKK
jgi:hypothetical protein